MEDSGACHRFRRGCRPAAQRQKRPQLGLVARDAGLEGSCFPLVGQAAARDDSDRGLSTAAAYGPRSGPPPLIELATRLGIARSTPSTGCACRENFSPPSRTCSRIGRGRGVGSMNCSTRGGIFA